MGSTKDTRLIMDCRVSTCCLLGFPKFLGFHGGRGINRRTAEHVNCSRAGVQMRSARVIKPTGPGGTGPGA